MQRRLRVLTISDLFPNPAQPAFGTFVERQVAHLQRYCDQVVIAPVRVFPHLRLIASLRRPARARVLWQDWAADLRRVPASGTVDGVPVYWPRYTSPPRQLVHALWGYCAYPFLLPMLRRIQAEAPIDLIHAHCASPAGVVALLAHRWLGVPYVVSVHGADVVYTARQRPLGAAIVRQIYQQAELVLANSRLTLQRVVECGADPARVRLVWLGGDAPEEGEASPPCPSSSIRLLSIGNLYRTKGHAEVVRAVRALRDEGRPVEYVVVGDGPERGALRAQVESLGVVDQVRFVGAVPHNAVWPYLRACDVFVLPSWNEAFGVVYVEALGQGKPIVGCQGAGGPEDLRALGDCVELVAPRDVASLVAALRRLIDDPDRRRRMGELGRRIVGRCFTWDGCARTTLEVYREAMETFSSASRPALTAEGAR